MASNYALFLRQKKFFVLSYVQTDATTPNFVGPIMNNVGSHCVSASSGVQTDASTPNNVGTYTASWEGYNPYGFGNRV